MGELRKKTIFLSGLMYKNFPDFLVPSLGLTVLAIYVKIFLHSQVMAVQFALRLTSVH